MSTKDYAQFESLMKKTNKIEGAYVVTTAKRITLLIPEGVTVYDSDLDKKFVGDGTTMGGVTSTGTKKVRVVAVAAAATGATASATTNLVTWSTGGPYVRTGDAIAFTSGTGGVLPSGLTSSGGTYYIGKTGDQGNGASNTGTSFKLYTARSGAVAKTGPVTIYDAGSGDWMTAIDSITVFPSDDYLLIDPVSAACSVILPDANSNPGFTVGVKRAKTASNAVTVKEADANNNVSASGSVVIDDAAAYVTLKAGTDDYLNLFANSAAGEYFTCGRQVTP